MAERTTFMCGYCSFKFSRDKSSRIDLKCPYCGKQSVQKYKPLTAEYFLNNVPSE